MSNIESTPELTVSHSDVTPALASGQANDALPTPTAPPSALEGFDRWIKDFHKYESILAEVAKASLDTKFKDELNTIEQWFKVLSEPERTASVYTLLQHSTQDQVHFFMSVLQRMVQPKPEPVSLDILSKPKLAKLSLRPPSLSIPLPGSPATPTPLTARSALDEQGHQANLPNAYDPSKWGSTVNTPLPTSVDGIKPTPAASNATAPIPGLGMMNPYTLNMLANAGLSTEAQLLAVQLIMSGLVQPTGGATAQPQAKLKKPSQASNWRTPTSARYPASALRSSGLRLNSGLKSAALKSSGLDSAALPSPREEDFDPEMLNDIPNWLRSLRLHKYTSSFDGLTWQEIVVLDDASLEARGVAALGARRRLLRTFEHVRKTMGMEEPNSATPTTSAMPTKLPAEYGRVPQSAAPRSKLSINSPIFTPTWDSKVPHSAAPSLSTSPLVEATLPADSATPIDSTDVAA
jgi:hypothetical protein